jgi:selenocysteine lyase/cysteine desulfurase
MDLLSARLPRARVYTPGAEDLRGGVVVFAVPGVDHDAVYQGVYETHRVGCAAMHGDFAGIRFSPHVYNTLDDLETAVAAVAAHV